jgi:hypothetical protein
MLGADMSTRLLLTHIILMTVLQMIAIWNVFDARTAPARYLSAAMVALLTGRRHLESDSASAAAPRDPIATSRAALAGFTSRRGARPFCFYRDRNDCSQFAESW